MTAIEALVSSKVLYMYKHTELSFNSIENLDSPH